MMDYKTTGILLLLLMLAFIFLTIPSRFVEALDDNVPFSLPGDYHGHYSHGWPFGFWRTYIDSEWMQPDWHWWIRFYHRIDPRALFLDGVLWGFFGLLACIPAGVQFIRMRKREKIW